MHESKSDDVWNIVDEVDYENGRPVLLTRLWKGYVEYLELYPDETPRTFLSFNS